MLGRESRTTLPALEGMAGEEEQDEKNVEEDDEDEGPGRWVGVNPGEVEQPRGS